MALYNFKRQFVPMVLSGEKTHTIRATRARATKVGETLYLYTGLRQKGTQKLMETVCTKVEQIEIHVDGSISIDGSLLSADEEETLARRDGFTDFLAMSEFWDGRRPFEGQIIHWRFQKEAV